MVRLPKNLSSNLTFKSGVIKTGESTLEHELLAEKAHSLGLAAKILTKALDALKEFTGDQTARDSLLQEAANAAQAFFIQRELMGMNDHAHPIKHYEIPRDVLAKIGVT